MIRSGHDETRGVIRDVSFRSASTAPVEITTNHAIRDRVGDDFFARPDRPSFDVLLLVEHGTGWHTVDFRRRRLVPGRMIRIGHGQVQQWDFTGDAECTVVMSATAAVEADGWRAGDDPARDLDESLRAVAESLVHALRVTQAVSGDEAASHRLMTGLFHSLWAVFDAAGPGREGRHLPPAYVEFRARLERDLAGSHRIEDRARELGYSARTLSRACQAVTGRTAKQVLTERLLLEAKRLLVHTDLPASAIGVELGFGEPTNFNRFFRRSAGETPDRFRRSWRGRS